MLSFEDQNVTAYTLLLRIEIVVRECLKRTYTEQFGKTWQKQLPGDLLKKVKESQKAEHRPNFNFVRLGPLAYLAFGELIVLLKNKHGQPVAKKFGGEVFVAQLENVLTPRNAVCHSRPVSTIGLQAIEVLYAQMQSTLGEDEIQELLSTADLGVMLELAAPELLTCLNSASVALPNLPPSFEITELFEVARTQYWWADDDLAGFDRLLVESAFEALKKYNALPRGVGSTGLRLRLSREENLEGQLGLAIAELMKV